MSEFVNVSLGDSPSIAEFPKTRIMCLIGKTAADVGVINNVQATTISDTSNLPSGTNTGRLAVTDNLYLAAVKYFQENLSGTLVLGGVSAAGATHDLELLEKISSTIWNSPYAPLASTTVTGTTAAGGDRVAINNIEILLNTAGVAEINADTQYGSETEGNWYTVLAADILDNTVVDKKIAVELVELIYTGKITFTGTVISIVPDAVNAVEVSVANIVSIRASVVTTSISETFKELVGAGIEFDGFAFAYDDAKEGDIAGAEGKYYGTTEAVGLLGWLSDVILGVNLAKQFNANKQRCMFYFGLPEKVLPTDDISDDMAAGTNYLAAGSGPIKYDAIRSVLGTTLYSAGFVTKQTYGASAIDPAVAAMAALASRIYRKNLTYAASGIGQSTDDGPSGPEWSLWKTSLINAYMYTKSDDTWQWGSGLTFGSGLEGDINHVRCKNQFAGQIEAVLNTLVKTNLTYDTVGYDAIRDSISSVQDIATGTYIDGPGTIIIPNESLVRREGSLTTGEQATLATLRATKTIDGISVGFRWVGDIEYINVTSIQAE